MIKYKTWESGFNQSIPMGEVYYMSCISMQTDTHLPLFSSYDFKIFTILLSLYYDLRTDKI